MPFFDNIFNNKRKFTVTSAHLDSILPGEGEDLHPTAVNIVARRIDLLTALSSRCPNALKYNKAAGHEASLLHYAVQDGSKEVIRFLLEREKGLLSEKDAKYGGTPLHWATTVEAVELLLDAGADPNALSDATGETPLCLALRYKRNEVVVALVELACDLNAPTPTKNAQQPLHMAVSQKCFSVEFATLLIAYGADVNAVNYSGDSVRHVVANRQKKFGIGDEGKELKKVLSLLHFAGAQRCPQKQSGCVSGCSASGDYNGEPVPGYTDQILAPLPDYVGVFDENTSEHQPNTGVKVLCLDDGLVQGLVSVMLLKKIEAAIARPINEVFQVIGGSGIGGLVSLFIAYNSENSLSKAQQFFYFLRRKMMSTSPVPKESVVEAYMKRFFDVEAKLDSVTCPQMMVTWPTNKYLPFDPTIIRNYPDPSFEPNEKSVDSDSSLVFKAAVAATGVIELTKGAILPNNLSLDLLVELSKARLEKMVFVSIGAAELPTQKIAVESTVEEGNANTEEQLTLAELAGSMASDRRIAEHARAWCRDANCAFARLAPVATLKGQMASIQPSQGSLEGEGDDTVRALFRLRVFLAQFDPAVSKLIAMLTTEQKQQTEAANE